MKILSIGNFTRGWDGSICDEEHIAKALEEYGHEVIRLQREKAAESVVSVEVDFILIAQWDGYPAAFKEQIQWTRAPLIYWAFDFQADGQEWHERLKEQCDLYLSKQLSDSKYSKWRWLSQDFAPDFLDRNELSEKQYDVLFTGTYLPWAKERIEILRAVDQNFNLVIHSVNPGEWAKAGFKNVNGPVMDEGLPELISRAKINISIDHTITPGYWSDRNAQIMACDGFVLFHYVPLSEVRFQDYLAYFNDIPSCLKSIQYFLEHDDDREEIAEFGYRYAHKNLMVKHRVRDLLTIVENM